MQEFLNFTNHHLMQVYIIAILFVMLMIVEYFRLKRNNFNIDPARAVTLINHDNAVVVDIRPKEQYQQGHIINAQLFTKKEMEEVPKKLEKLRTNPLIIVCATGLESQKVAALYAKKGYNSSSLSGGMRSWITNGLPIVKG